jgi:hypothetical protein
MSPSTTCYSKHPTWRHGGHRWGSRPKLSDAELLTLAVMQALLGFTSKARWLRYAGRHLRHLFP